MKREINLYAIYIQACLDSKEPILPQDVAISAMKKACELTIDECAFNLMNDKEWHNAFELNKQIKTIQKTKDQIK